jgi:phosphoribosylformylglycinamidine cyclo-ligase
MNAHRYASRGVSADKTGVHHAIRGLDKGVIPNAFCKVLPDIYGNDPAYVCLLHADTAGTKTSIAYLYFKETGDRSVWKNICTDALIMNLDDMGAAGISNHFIISSTIGRNAQLISDETLSDLIQGTQAYLEHLNSLDITVSHAGGETADVGDIVRTLDVGFTAFARAKKEQILPIQIEAGQVIVGLASFGQTKYEQEYNSGIGCNGLTSAKHDVLSSYYTAFKEGFSPDIDPEFVFNGSYRLSDIETISGLSIGKLLLSPTRTYLPFLKPALEQFRKEIYGIIHNTGGALTKVLKFNPKGTIIKDNLFPTPPVFELIKKESKSEASELYKVFNMGQRLEIYTNLKTAGKLILLAESLGIEARIIGKVIAASPTNPALIIEGPEGTARFN